MPDWKNWKWERQINKIHSSYRKKGNRKRDKQANNQLNYKLNWSIKPFPIFAMFVLFWVIFDNGFFESLAVAIAASLMFNFSITEGK